VTEAATPAVQPSVDLVDHHGDGDEAPLGSAILLKCFCCQANGFLV
jgi:hypothetical protein